MDGAERETGQELLVAEVLMFYCKMITLTLFLVDFAFMLVRNFE